MRKPISLYDLSELNSWSYEDDHEIKLMMHNTMQDITSTDKWLYLGADITNSNWAKIGITSGNLSSRSYSSANPNYYIFCAFQFKHNVTKEQMRIVEKQLLYKFDQTFIDLQGNSLRLRHYESKNLSECYYPINFIYLLDILHSELYHNHSCNFITHEYENDFGGIYGGAVACVFSPTLDQATKQSLLNRLMQS